MRSTPIDALNPYTNKWQIKARVTNKSDLRTYSSAKGDGSVFSLDLCDESAEIRATAWRDVADRLYSTLDVGSTYIISRGQLKVANKKFSTLNNNYEITLTFETQIPLCADEPPSKPKVHYRFCPIGDITSRPKDAVVDVIGVVSNVSATQSLTTKAGKELVKRTMNVADDSGKSIELTLWGEKATAFPDLVADDVKVVAFKGLRVSEWNQRSLGASFSSTYDIEPEQESEIIDRLKAWWEAGGAGSTESISVNAREGGAAGPRDDSSRMTTAEFVERGETLAVASEPLYASMRCYMSKTLGGAGGGNQGEERSIWYGACPKCNKKVVGDDASGHSCENCGWSGAECAYRYILPIVVLDAEGSCVMTAFNDQATALLGIKADDLKKLKDTSPAQYEAALAKGQWKQYVLRTRGKMDSYNNNTRLKSHVLSAASIKFAEEAKLMLSDIAKYGTVGA
jgi:replication factor A1